MTAGRIRAEPSLYHVWLGATDDDDAGRDYLARMTGQEAAQLEQCAGNHEIWSSVERLDVLDQSILEDCTVADCEFNYRQMIAAVRDTATLLDPDDASTLAMNIFRELLQEHGVHLEREGVAIQISVKHEELQLPERRACRPADQPPNLGGVDRSPHVDVPWPR